MQPSDLRVEATRGELVESVHRIDAAVVDADGHLVASAGNPELVTWWRSAAKPFQALPLLQDGAAARFGLTDEDVALACASHSSEPRHIEAVSRFMERAGVTEDQLSCGTHPPLSAEVARAVLRGTVALTPRWSNCSGKHTGMLALAQHHGWPAAGYYAAGHPVQERIVAEIGRWTGSSPEAVKLSVDGCTAVCFGLPVRAMALGYARLGASAESEARRIVATMMTHPFLVAGTGRLCTDLMTAWPGKVIAKVGAEGIYSAALPELKVGITLKVEDGDMQSSSLALLEILRQVLARHSPAVRRELPFAALAVHDRQAIRNTRNSVTGEVRAAGQLRFFDA